ncbi:MAG: putative transcriptional regulator [Firmicutes bacterium]|nr:putative transcriptional regulator [Bacillota bacterium]
MCLETLGELLRKERESRGLSLKDIENAVNIRVLYLNAIENGEYHIIPGEVYLKGFIRNYANYLGLNGAEIVDLYRKNQTPPPQQIISETIIPAQQTSPNTSRFLKNRKILAGFAVGCILLGTGWYVLSSGPSTPAGSSLVSSRQSVTAPAPIAKIDQPAVQTIVITAKFSDQCWTLITADGKEVYEGIPQNGTSMTWTAKQTLIIKVGNAEAVDLIFNGQNVNKIGGKGEVVEKTFSLNTTKKP